MRALIILAIIVTAFGLALYWFLQSGADTQPTTQLTSQEPPVSQDKGDNPAPPWRPPNLDANTYESDLGPLPESLKDTRIPFDIRVDEQNHLIIEASLRRLFDYFFTLEGEESLATIKTRIMDLLDRFLPEPARSEAIAIFQDYVAVKEAEIELRDQLAANYKASGQSVNLAERVRLMRELRQSLLSHEVYDAFYGQEDQRAQYTLQRHDILRDEALSLVERNNALRELDRQLPENLQAAKEEEYVYEEITQRIENARESGASEADIFQMRSEAYGQEAAQRFAEADREQAEWDHRVAIYREQRRAIMESGLSSADQSAELKRLREQHFSGTELLRIPVVDRMYDEQGKP